MSVLRIAAGIALNPSAESRWRQVSVFVSAMVFTAMLLGSASVVSLWAKEESRKSDQVAVLSSIPAPSDVLLLSSSDEWRGQHIEVVSFEPGPGAPLPPGLAAWPKQGGWAVSDALARLADANPALARRYPAHMRIAASGVRSGGDLLAYHVLPSGVLPSDHRVMRLENGRYTGDGPVIRVASFKPATSRSAVISLTPPSHGSLYEVVAGAAIALVMPALVVLAVGLGSGSAMRTYRFGVLNALGVPGRVRRRIATTETLILALPGALIAALGWAVGWGTLEQVPVVGYPVARGDLALPWWALTAVLLVSVLTVTLMAMAGFRLRRRHGAGSGRPGAQRSVLSLLALVPAGIAAAAFMAGKMIGGEADATFFFIGTAAAVIGTPLLMPALLRSAGSVLAATRSPTGSLVGNGMVWDPARTGRPFIGLGAALVLTLAAIGYIARAQVTEAPSVPRGGPQAVAVQWRGAGPDALSAHAADLGGLVIPYKMKEAAPGSTSTITLAVTCAQLARVMGGECSPMAPFAIEQRTRDALLTMIAPIGLAGAPLTQVALVPGADIVGHEPHNPEQQEGAHHHDAESALVLAVRPLRTLDEHVRNVSTAALPVVKVSSPVQSVQAPSPLIAWIRGGLILALAAMALACVVSLVDRLLAARRHHLQLVAMGASPRQMAALGAWTFSAPYAVVCLASSAAGIFICSLIVRPIVPMPWTTVGAVLVVAVSGGALGALATAVTGGKTAPTPRD